MTKSQTFVFIGTYTAKLPHVDAKADGISVYQLDMLTGALSFVSELKGQENPTYLELARQCVYIANEIESGFVTTCKFDDANGTLQVLNQQSAQGTYPCHIALHENGKFAFIANYGSGNLTVYPISEEGHLGEASEHIQHEGSSINAVRQEAAHAHCIAIDSAKNRVFVADLGMDKIMIYDFDPSNGRLSLAKQAFVEVAAGAGLRHLAFHPSRKWLFAINELDSTMTVFAYDSESGYLEAKQSISTLPDDFQEESFGAAIQVHPNGQFIYGSNRGHDSIAIFAFDEQTGLLTAIGHESTQGKAPRDFAIDPSGRFLLVANQNTDTIVSFLIDSQTGTLQTIGQILVTPTPVCVKMRVI
jgi:6-phosphogluconolactonase